MTPDQRRTRNSVFSKPSRLASSPSDSEVERLYKALQFDGAGRYAPPLTVRTDRLKGAPWGKCCLVRLDDVTEPRRSRMCGKNLMPHHAQHPRDDPAGHRRGWLENRRHDDQEMPYAGHGTALRVVPRGTDGSKGALSLRTWELVCLAHSSSMKANHGVEANTGCWQLPRPELENAVSTARSSRRWPAVVAARTHDSARQPMAEDAERASGASRSSLFSTSPFH